MPMAVPSGVAGLMTLAATQAMTGTPWRAATTANGYVPIGGRDIAVRGDPVDRQEDRVDLAGGDQGGRRCVGHEAVRHAGRRQLPAVTRLPPNRGRPSGTTTRTETSR